MKALILAAGLGSRLKLENIPKPMYEINGKPILEHNILLLKKHGILNICITLHYMGDVIKTYFGDGKKWGVNIQYSDEKELLGTSGALKNISWFIDKEPFLVIYGDNYTDINISEMIKFHKSAESIATIALFDPKKSLNSGIAGGVVILDKNNNIQSFIEGKGDKVNGYVNAGVYVLESKILDMIPNRFPSDFGKDIFPKLLNEGFLLRGYITSSFVLAIDTKEALTNTEFNLLKGAKSNDNN